MYLHSILLSELEFKSKQKRTAQSSQVTNQLPEFIVLRMWRLQNNSHSFISSDWKLSRDAKKRFLLFVLFIVRLSQLRILFSLEWYFLNTVRCHFVSLCILILFKILTGSVCYLISGVECVLVLCCAMLCYLLSIWMNLLLWNIFLFHNYLSSSKMFWVVFFCWKHCGYYLDSSWNTIEN